MSDTLIDHWLNDEIEDESKMHLEAWLREDPEHLQDLWDGVQLQEDLRVHFGARPVAVSLPSQPPSGIRLFVALSAAAAIILAAFFIIPRRSDPRPTADPLVWVLAGNPQVDMARIDPGPNPVAIPREQWPVETRVTIAHEPSSLRWNEGCVLQAGANTALTLRPARDRAPEEPRSIRLDRGSLTVHLEAPSAPVDVFAGDSQVRASHPAVFTLKDSGPQPVGREAVLSVVRGNVELLLPDAKKRSVMAGERVSLP